MHKVANMLTYYTRIIRQWLYTFPDVIICDVDKCIAEIVLCIATVAINIC